MKAILALEDGSLFHGEAFGARASACGEVCFNTSMTGYQEILTDPSYKGQIVTMTYPRLSAIGARICRSAITSRIMAFPAFKASTHALSPENCAFVAR